MTPARAKAIFFFTPIIVILLFAIFMVDRIARNKPETYIFTGLTTATSSQSSENPTILVSSSSNSSIISVQSMSVKSSNAVVFSKSQFDLINPKLIYTINVQKDSKTEDVSADTAKVTGRMVTSDKQKFDIEIVSNNKSFSSDNLTRDAILSTFMPSESKLTFSYTDPNIIKSDYSRILTDEIKGNLFFNNVSRQVIIKVTKFDISDSEINFIARTDIKLSDFNFSTSLFANDWTLGDDVEIMLSGTLK